MAEKKTSLTKKLVHAGGWKLARRVGKTIPGVGTALAIGFVGYDIKKKGFINGILNSGLDAVPFVGMGKNILEMFTGDLLPDKTIKNGSKMPTREKNEVKK